MFWSGVGGGWYSNEYNIMKHKGQERENCAKGATTNFSGKTGLLACTHVWNNNNNTWVEGRIKKVKVKRCVVQCGPGECCTAGVCEQQRLVSHGGPGGGDQAGAGLSRVCLGFSSAPPAQAQGCGPAPAPLPRPPSLVFSPSLTHSHLL